jgi:hypothetical protein
MLENASPSLRKRFLWWLSTAEEALLSDCLIDQNRFAIIGLLVMGTWIFASLAWMYFFSTVVSAWWIALPLGAFMGWIILQIDRALIKGIGVSNKQKITPIIVRGILAISIGLFMAQPALLFLFDKEVKAQVSLDNEKRKQVKLNEQELLYQAERSRLIQIEKNAKSELNKKYAEVAAAREAFIKETDGTGGSKKIGLKSIALAKQSSYEKLDKEYNEEKQQLAPQIAYAQTALKNLDKKINEEQIVFQSLLNNGFITRIEALNHLVESSNAVAFRYYLLVALLMLIELMPVIAKLLIPEGSYELKVQLRLAMEKEKALNNQALIKSFFEASYPVRKDKMETSLSEWKNNHSISFKEKWETFNNELCS